MARQHIKRLSKGSMEDRISAPPGSPTKSSTGADEGYFPSPPPRPPSASGSKKDARPGSSSSRRRKYSAASIVSSEGQGDVDPFARRPSRPSSSLSKYKPLPDIPKTPKSGPQTKKVEKVSENFDKLELEYKRSKDNSPVKNSRKTAERDRPLKKERESESRPSHTRDMARNPGKSPKEKSHNSVVLGIKNPVSGERISKSFSSSDTMESILKFAEKDFSMSLTRTYFLAVNMPRKVFDNPRMTIKQAGLEERTTLYLVEKELV